MALLQQVNTLGLHQPLKGLDLPIVEAMVDQHANALLDLLLIYRPTGLNPLHCEHALAEAALPDDPVEQLGNRIRLRVAGGQTCASRLRRRGTNPKAQHASSRRHARSTHPLRVPPTSTLEQCRTAAS